MCGRPCVFAELEIIEFHVAVPGFLCEAIIMHAWDLSIPRHLATSTCWPWVALQLQGHSFPGYDLRLIEGMFLLMFTDDCCECLFVITHRETMSKFDINWNSAFDELTHKGGVTVVSDDDTGQIWNSNIVFMSWKRWNIKHNLGVVWTAAWKSYWNRKLWIVFKKKLSKWMIT